LLAQCCRSFKIGGCRLGQVAEHATREHAVKNTGDGLLAEFPSVFDAVRCAADAALVLLDLRIDQLTKNAP
jgi:class 3 adenylate cyclase